MTQSQTVQSNALRLLKAIYERTHNQSNPVDDVARLNTGLTEGESKAAWRYLRDKGLIQTFNLDYAARINARGVDAIENDQSHPHQSTPLFPSVIYNTIHIDTMVNSSVQQASPHSTQTQTHSIEIQKGDWTALSKALESYGIQSSEITKLQSALNEDSEGADTPSLGQHTATWLKHLGSAGLSTGIEVAKTVVTKWVQQFLGLPQ